MDRRRETGMAVIFAVFIILLMSAICLLSSCTTKQKVVTEYVAVHDTIHTHHTDTIRDVRVVTLTDTVKYVEKHELTVNNVGDTIKEIHHYYDRQTITCVDSTYRYKAERDSLKAALDKSQSKEKVIVKTKFLIRWWEWVLFFSFLAAIILYVKKSKIL